VENIINCAHQLKNLEANLRNHFGKLKYKNAFEDFIVEGGNNLALSTGCHGRPAKPHKTVYGNQK
jgi:hypothetical protein